MKGDVQTEFVHAMALLWGKPRDTEPGEYAHFQLEDDIAAPQMKRRCQ
jgi:hypothetical protein